MKKLLLTLGSAAAAVAPMATVVACGSTSSVTLKGTSTVEAGHLTIKGFAGPTHSLDNDSTEADETAAMNEHITFMNLMGIQLVAAGQDITKVTLDGELAGNDGSLVAIEFTTDFSKVAAAADLAAYIATLTEDADGQTASGQAFEKLAYGGVEDDSTGGDTDTSEADLITVKAALDAMTVETTVTEDNVKALGAGSQTLSDLGFADGYFDSIINGITTWTIVDYSLDLTGGSETLNIEVEKASDSTRQDLAVSFADITFA